MVVSKTILVSAFILFCPMDFIRQSFIPKVPCSTHTHEPLRLNPDPHTCIYVVCSGVYIRTYLVYHQTPDICIRSSTK